MGLKYASIEAVDVRDLCPKPDFPFRVRRSDSTRHKKLAFPKFTAFGDCWRRGRIWNDLCCNAGLDRDAQATIKRWHEPKDGSNHGSVSDPLGLLWSIDCFTTGGVMECRRGIGEFAERRCVPAFRP